MIPPWWPSRKRSDGGRDGEGRIPFCVGDNRLGGKGDVTNDDDVVGRIGKVRDVAGEPPGVGGGVGAGEAKEGNRVGRPGGEVDVGYGFCVGGSSGAESELHC